MCWKRRACSIGSTSSRWIPMPTVDDLLQNLAGMKELGAEHLPYSIFNRLMAFKGTRLAERLGEDGLLKTSSNAKAYMGEMPYRFREPGMDRVMDLAERVDRRVKEVLRRLKQVFSWRSSGTAELEFGRKLMRAIHEGALDLATKALRVHREGREREARALLTRDLRAISRSVRRVEKFSREGGFKHFRTLEVSIGGRRVSYPVEEARLVTRELQTSAAGEGLIRANRHERGPGELRDVSSRIAQTDRAPGPGIPSGESRREGPRGGHSGRDVPSHRGARGCVLRSSPVVPGWWASASTTTTSARR